MNDFSPIFLHDIRFRFLDTTIFELFDLKCLCSSFDDRTINILFGCALFNHNSVLGFRVIDDMTMHFWNLLAFIYIDNLGLFSYNVTVSVLDGASIYESFMSGLIFGNFLLSSHNVTFLILNNFNFSLYLLIVFELVGGDCLNSLLSLMNFDCVLFVFNLSDFGFGFNYIPICIFNNAFLNYFGFSFFLDNIFFVLKHRTILTTFNLNCVLLLSNQYTVYVDNLVGFNHGDFTFLFDYFWFMLVHVTIIMTFDFDNVSLHSYDFASRIFNCVSVYKGCFSLFFNQLLFMGMGIS